jgi:hypothetical protein
VFSFGGGYNQDDEGPEARMSREIQAQHEKDCKAVDKLLASLRPADAHQPLISFTHQKQFGIKRRSRPVD